MRFVSGEGDILRQETICPSQRYHHNRLDYPVPASTVTGNGHQLYDSNCDGMLDFDEFSEGITMCQLDHLFPRSLQRTLFDKIDTDKVQVEIETSAYISE